MERIWEDADRLNLFAWLDFCVQNSLDFKGTIKQRLTDWRDARSGNIVSFTSKQVKQKIIDESRKFARHKKTRALSLHHILEIGSSAIIGLPHELHQEIEKRVLKYTLDYPHLFRKGQPSESILESHDTTQLDPEKGHDEADQRQNRTQIAAVSQLDLHSHQSLGAPQLTHLEGQVARPKHQTESPRPQTFQNKVTTTNRQEVTFMAHLEEPSSRIGRKEGMHEGPRRNQSLNSGRPNPEQPRHFDNKLPVETQTIMLTEKVQETQEIEGVRAQWQREVEAFAERERKQSCEIEELQATNRNLLLAQQERRAAGPDPLEATLFDKSQEIWQLRQRVKRTSELEQFIEKDESRKGLIDPNVLDDEMDQIRSELECIAPSNKMVTANFTANSDLGSLIQTISAASVEKDEEVSWLRSAMLKFNPETILRALVVGALHEWVFATRFPDFAPADTQLLGVYREIISRHGKVSKKNYHSEADES